MKVKLSYQSFDTIMKSAKNFVDIKDAPRICGFIYLQVSGGVVQASALDEYKVMQIIVSAEDGSDTGDLYVPLVKPIGKKGEYAEIEDTGTEIVIFTAECTMTFPRYNGGGFNYSRLFCQKEPPKISCYYDSKKLIETFSSFTGVVAVEYYGEKKGLIVKGCGGTHRALVLPCSPRENEQAEYEFKGV